MLGISPDSTKSHRKFIEKHQLNYTLLSDADHKVAERYGVWVEKMLYGRKYWGVARTTFVLDERGRVARIFDKVKPSREPSILDPRSGGKPCF